MPNFTNPRTEVSPNALAGWMKLRVALRASGERWAGAAALLLCALLSNTAVVHAAEVGTTAGQFAVDAGAATYSIPISLPPGSGSMAPELALTYSSQGGDGPFGPGWQLSGVSAITRCPATLANDGFIDGVDLDDKDRLCLDGQRLVAVSGVYGANGAEYRKEIDDFTRIRGYDSLNHRDARFVAETKSGLTYVYGYKGTTSQAKAPGLGTAPGLRDEVMSWAVTQIRDKAGNYIEFAYSQDTTTKEHLLTKISYTGHLTTGMPNPSHTVELVYQPRPVGTMRYLWSLGGRIQQAQRVESIVVKAEGTQVRVYKLGYELAGEDTVARLKQVTECVNGTTCLNPTTFQWPAEQVGFDPVAKNTNIAPFEAAKSDDYPLDLNGDGRTDLLAVYKDAAGNKWYGMRRMQANDTFAARQDTPIARWSDPQKTELIDYQGDGLIDVITRKSDVSTEYNLHLNSGTGFGAATHYPIVFDGTKTLERQTFADLTGDGIGDVLWVANGDQGPVNMQIGTGSGFSAAQVTEGTKEKNTQRHVADFTGDGLPDVVACSPDDGLLYYHLYVNTGAGFAAEVNTRVSCGGSEAIPHQLGDFNGDGLADIIAFGITGHVTTFHIYLATGNPSAPFYWMTAGDASGGDVKQGSVEDSDGISNVTNALLIQDVNGDGLSDILVQGLNPETVQPDASFKGYALYLNTGKYQTDRIFDVLEAGGLCNPCPDQIAFTGPIDSKVQTHSEAEYKNKWGDFNGDGAADLMIYDVPTKGQYNIVYGRPQASAITHITNGLGAQIEIVYKPLTDASVYTKATGASYPIREVQAAMPVVAEYKQSDGLGGLKRTKFSYQGLRNDVKRGSLGFAAITSTDVGTGLSATTTYRQVFPLTGTVSSVQVKTGSGKLVTTTINTHVAGQLGSGAATRHVPLLTRSDARSYEPADAGTAPVTSTRTDHTYDSWGNVITSTVSTYTGEFSGTPHKVVTTNTYAATDVTNWTLARLTRTVVDKTLPDGGTSRRISAFDYDSKGLLSAETIEPDDASLRLRTEYLRDKFGNVIQTTVGAGTAEARISKATYDAKGRYPESSTNALGHVTSTTYDAWGNPTKVTSANGLVTSATYDAFGREWKKTDVLGKTGTVVRQWCTAALCPAVYESRGSYRVEAQSPDGGKSAVVYDALEREIGKEVLTFDGSWSRQITTYDANGRVAETSAPFFDGETQHWTVYDYDELGRPIAEASDKDQSETIQSRIIQMQYGPLWVKQTDPLGKVRYTYKNAIGQVVRVLDPDGEESIFAYDPEGHLIRSTDAQGNVSTLDYDQRGQKIRSDDPDMGVWTYTYTRFSELATQTDAKGQQVSNTYDRLGRLVQSVDAARTTTWTYDTLWKGALTEVSATDGYRDSLTYDTKGRVDSRTQKIGGVDYRYAYVYDALGRVQTLTYPSGFRIRQTFKPGGHLESVVNDATGAAFVTIEKGDARGNTTGYVYGNGVRTAHTFDAAQGFTLGITATNSSATVLHKMAFGWDLIGNLAARLDQRRNLAETFAYDNLNRLKSATVSVNGVVKATDSFTYDALGNIRTKTGVGTYTYGEDGAGPHAVTSITGTRPEDSFTYDANGNMLSGWGRVITWSPTNLPTDITQGSNRVQFVYAPDGQRIVQVETGLVPRTVVYAGGLYEKESNGSAVAHRHFVQAGGQTVAIHVTSGAASTTQYLHRDHQGSVTLLTDPAGAPLEYLSYDAFGKRRNAMTWAADPTDALLQTNAHKTLRGYTGHEQLDRVELIHMNGRVYDATLGRFISPDPFVQFPLSTQGLNRYTYVDNNPLSFTDPSGFFLKGLVKGLAKMAAQSKLLGPALVMMTCTNPGTAVACAAAVAATVAGTQTAINGGSPSDSLKAAGVAAFQVHAFNAIGGAYNFADAPVRNVVLHGVVGGISSVVMGGKFSAGFIGQAASAAITPFALKQNRGVGTLMSAIVGGTAEEIAGGKFANGAMTSAFGYLFNADRHADAEEFALSRLAGDGAYSSAGGRDDVVPGYKKIWHLITESGLKVAFFQNVDNGKYYLVPAGTDTSQWADTVADAVADIEQLWGRTAQYEEFIEIAKEVNLYTKGNVVIAGHSLGAGMAAVGAGAINGKAVIFNSAGLNPHYRAIAANAHITHFYSNDDVLQFINLLQPSISVPADVSIRVMFGGMHGIEALGKAMDPWDP